MADNYLQPVSNHFGFSDSMLEDVDDNDFLNNARLRSPGSGIDNSMPRSDSGGAEIGVISQQILYEKKRREIEERSLQSTQRSLGLLYDTEEVGTSTAVELAKQREQLERTNKNLDDINATLRSEPSPPHSSTTNARRLSNESQTSARSESTKQKLASPNAQYDQHPVSRIRDDSSSKQQHKQSQDGRRNNPFEDQLEANLNEMSDNLSRLKGLASDLGAEIESQNELLNNMNYKIEDVDIKLAKQNKDMYKLLEKK